MTSSQQVSIGSKVLYGFVPVAALFLFGGGYLYLELHGTQSAYDHLLRVDIERRRQLQGLESELLELQGTQARYFERNDPKELEEGRRLAQTVGTVLADLKRGDDKNTLGPVATALAEDQKLFDKRVAIATGQEPAASPAAQRDLAASSETVERTLDASVRQLAADQAARTDVNSSDIANGFERATWALWGLFVVILGSLLIVSWFVRSVVAAIQEITAAATEISEQGTLDRQVRRRSNDELGDLATAFNKMVLSTRTMVVQLREATGGLAAAGTQIVAATSQQSASATEQAASTAEATTTIEEIRQTADQAAERAREMIATAERSEQISKTGALAVEQSIAGVNEVRSRVNSIATNILALSERTQQIGDIIATVNELAERSNLLAINAAIEAAKAADHGKGFAVVATEVRNLASQSKLATKEVRTILGEIQKATNSAVMVTEEGAKRSDVVVRQAEQAGANIRELAQVIQATAQAARQIASSSRQQAGGIDQIVLAFRHINEATQQTVSGARETETGALGLKDLADRLNKLVAPYRV